MESPNARYNSYLEFIHNLKPFESTGIDEVPLEGVMYDEQALFRIIRSMDQLITLSEVSAEGY